MANELNFYGDLTQTGLTVIARVYNSAGVIVGTDVSCSEAGTLAIYTGDMPTTTIGQYGVRFFDSSDDSLLSQGSINWDGAQEIEFNLDVAVSSRSNHASPDLSALQTTADADAKQAALISEIDANEAKIDLIPTTSSSYDDTVLIGKIDVIDSNVDSIKTTTDNLVNADLSGLETKAQADARQTSLIAEHNQTQTDISNITFSDTAILTAIAALNDISTADIRTELATELSRLDVSVSSVAYNDTALTALVNALPTLAQMEASAALTAIADITGLSTHDAAAVVTAMQVVADDFKADVSGINFDDTAILNAISALNDLSVADVEGSNLAKEATLTSIVSSIAAIPTTDSVADLAPVLTAISSLNDPTVAEIVTGLQAVADDFKADLTGVAYDDTSLISKIDLIDSIVDTILLDTDELQTNQGNFATATGFATPTDISNSQTAIIAEVDANEAKIDLIPTSSGGYDDTALIAKVDTIDLNVDSIKSITDNLVNTDLTSVLSAIAALNDIDLATIEGSSVLAKEASLTAIATSISAIPTTDNVADLTPVLTAISNLNNVTPAEVRAAFNEVDFQDKNTETEIHTWLNSYTNKDDWKGTSSGTVDLTPVQTVVDAILIDTNELQQNQIDISGLSTFDHTTDQVVASNMRGTDNANTIAPDNANIGLIKTKVDTLENTDLTGIALTTDIRTQLAVELARLDVDVSSVAYDDTALIALINTLPILTEIEASNLLAKTSDITGLTIPQLTDILATIKPDLTIINDGIKKSSLIIPHTTDLT